MKKKWRETTNETVTARWVPVAGAALVVLLALTVRLHGLDREGLWMDEIHQASIASKDLSEIIVAAAKQQQPPLDYWIEHVAQAISPSDFSVRLPAAVFGTVAVLLMMLVVSKTASWNAAVITGLVMAFLPFHVHYSQEARPYALTVCLFSALLLCLSLMMEAKRLKTSHGMCLLLTAVAFLYSMSLAPLVVVAVAALALILLPFFPTDRRTGKAEPTKMLCISAGILLVSAILYFPNLAIVLHHGKRYAPDAARIDLQVFWAALSNFNLFALWRAYMVQLDPLGPWLLPWLVAFPFLASRTRREKPFAFYVALLLPAACIVHMGIFAAKARYVFQPRYPIYLMPLVLLWVAYTGQCLWDMTRDTTRQTIGRVLIVSFTAACLVLTVQGAFGYHATTRKTDWRGLCRYLQEAFGPDHVLIFDSLNPYGDWEPTFYGFDRYYRGTSTGLPVERIPTLGPTMVDNTTHEGVFILYYPRRVSLTSSSRYPLGETPAQPFDCTTIQAHDSLAVRHFLGFCVIRTKNRTGNLARDTLFTVEELIRGLKPDSSVVELHLAAAALYRALGTQGWNAHLDAALALAPEGHRSKVQSVVQTITGGGGVQ